MNAQLPTAIINQIAISEIMADGSQGVFCNACESYEHKDDMDVAQHFYSDDIKATETAHGGPCCVNCTDYFVNEKG
jgi:hypothetical protein